MSIRKAVAQFCASTILTSTIVCCSHAQIKPVSIAGATCYGSATSLIDAIRRGKISAVELLDACLDRIERYNPDINAVVALDQKSARARAAAADAALAQGEVWGPLHGLPMTVKDVFEVKGMPATSGDPLLKGHRPGRNATAVQRLLDAGAIVFGKTNAPYHGMDIQTYNEVYGTTSNPWDLTRTPGGSSGGSAAALAAGFTPLEMGSDIAGSLRIPALYAGVFGHKPTFGIVPRLGHIPPMPGQVPPGAVPGIPLFVVGPMARCADDLELALRVLATGSRTDQSNPAAKLLPPRKPRFKAYRVAVWLSDEHPGAQIDDSVMTVLQAAVKKLEAAGLDVDRQARPGVDLGDSMQVWREIFLSMTTGVLPLPEALAARQQKQQAMWAEFFRHHDVLLAPVAPTTAFPHDHRGTVMSRRLEINGRLQPMSHNMTWTYMANVSGLPVSVAPVGFSAAGLPVGVQIIGARFADLTTIDFARGLADLLGGFVPPSGYGD